MPADPGGSGGGATLSVEAAERRRAAVAAARHSIEMEGGRVSEDARVVQDAFVAGELTLDEYLDRARRGLTVAGRPRRGG